MDQIYLDYQSAKPVDSRVVDAMLPYFTEDFGNPSSLHKVGDIGTETLDRNSAGCRKFCRRLKKRK